MGLRQRLQLNKEGYLKAHTAGTFNWSIGGHTLCSIGYRLYIGKMNIHYIHRSDCGESVSTQQDIIFDRTKCNYGGSRLWFKCSKCGRRVAVLYYLTGGFLCRHCHNLTYASQQEDKEYRMMRKASKIRKRLGAVDSLLSPIWEKPKYMHQSTFDRLRSEAEGAHNASWIISEKRFTKFPD